MSANNQVAIVMGSRKLSEEDFFRVVGQNVLNRESQQPRQEKAKGASH
jgi:hypothetical protein